MTRKGALNCSEKPDGLPANKPGKPITVGYNPIPLAITPNGKTVYAGNYNTSLVTPISTATNKAGKPIKTVSAPTINWRLQAIKDAPALVGGKTLVLRYLKPDRAGRHGGFRVEELDEGT